uniref:Ankyrin repeat domain 33 n=1 Tax=Zonotrichia albicollis TaxID=44394 RepID=A0A8D2MNN2_ZONAL
MKAAVQGRQDCVTALLLAGADLQAVDAVKGKTAREWATFTGRFETTVRIRSLLRRPRAEQFAAQYQPEWPALAELVAKALSPKSRSKRLSEKIRSIFTFNIPRNPEEDGVLDHMVRMTTAMGSPFVATACQTVCPDSPPEVGKRRSHYNIINLLLVAQEKRGVEREVKRVKRRGEEDKRARFLLQYNKSSSGCGTWGLLQRAKCRELLGAARQSSAGPRGERGRENERVRE